MNSLRVFDWHTHLYPDALAPKVVPYLAARFGNLESLLGSPDVLFSFANRMARAESIRGGLEPELTLAAMAQIFPEDRGQNYALRMGRKAPELLGIAGGTGS